jgi:microcystin-dependent protein
MTLFTWSKAASSNATADATINWAEGQSPSSVNDSARSTMAAVAKFRDDTNGSITTGGASTAYTVTSNQVFDALAHLDRQELTITPHVSCGNAPTLSVDSLGAKPVYNANGVAAGPGDMVANVPLRVTYSNSSGLFQIQGAPGVPTGALLPFAGSAAPNGFLLCGGQAASRTTYAVLFAVIGTTYGTGDGSTTFNVPDLRGRLPAGKDDMNGSAANRVTSGGSGITGTTLGASGGEETHLLASGEMPAHTHAVSGNTGAGTAHHHAGVPTLNGQFAPGSGSNATVNTSTGNSSDESSHTHPISLTSASTGGGGAHNNMPPALVVNYIIKT